MVHRSQENLVVQIKFVNQAGLVKFVIVPLFVGRIVYSRVERHCLMICSKKRRFTINNYFII